MPDYESLHSCAMSGIDLQHKNHSQDFLLTEMDEWAILSDSDDDAGSGQENKDEQKPTKKSKKTKVRKLAKKKGSDDEVRGSLGHLCSLKRRS